MSSNKNVTLKEMAKNGLAAPFLVIIMLAMLVVPMPPFALDLLFTFNIALSLVVLLAAIYALRPLDFTSFPTILLAATILRLGLNIASTRVVLMEGHTGTAAAGAVIESFGEFVAGGNYAVGLVVFSILVIINFVVVTKGAGRVSEVSARFTLDALPGKQMAVDADMNAGLLTQKEAAERRKEISMEADFYGSMDGASKFVRGDAVAGILILFINVIGGLAIGVGQHGMAFSDAVHNYTLLTIGDGLVAQLPSLLLSTATAVIVTRVSTSADMGTQISKEIFSDPRALMVTGVILGLIGIIPGMPNVVFLMLSAACAGGVYLIQKNNMGQVDAVTEEPKAEPLSDRDLNWDDVKPTDVLGMEIGYKLIPLVDGEQEGSILARIKGVRRKLSEHLGFLVQPVHIRDNLDLPPGQYRIMIHGVPEGEGEIHPDRDMAINPGTASAALQGIPTTDPAFGMNAFWIEPAQRDHAQMQGYTVVDASTVVATHLNKILLEHAAELLGHEETEHLLEKLKAKTPKLVDELVPKTLPLATVVKVLQNLLHEGIPVTDMRQIAETMAEQAVVSQDADTLTTAVRVSLRRLITQQINGLEKELPVMTLAPELEQLLHQSLNNSQGNGLIIEPSLADRINQSLVETCQQQELSNEPSVLLVSSELRPWLARMLRTGIPRLKVLAYNEISDSKQLRVISSIGNASANAELAHAAA
ncbi:MAG TPA: flagellar biosynthesis protein FlhA [Gammaproteobacteria bacterium]|jgi:flagellar biosynthesis protein FlhA|nr:flagellar biosynthesis protein FlhA [Gammaproteobacteria bacterium]